MTFAINLSEVLKEIDELEKLVMPDGKTYGAPQAAARFKKIKELLAVDGHSGLRELVLDPVITLDDLADFCEKFGLVPNVVFKRKGADEAVAVSLQSDDPGKSMETYDEVLHLGDVVELKDTSRAFRWYIEEDFGRTYDQAIVACLAPLVLVASDCKARWNKVKPNELRVVASAADGLLHRTRDCLTQEELVATAEVTRLEVR